MLSASTVINQSVSLASAAALWAWSDPLTPWMRLAQGTLLQRSA